IAATRNGISLDFPTAARLYNLSQLGKYVPGSIWQFVGRAAAYRRRGAAYGAIRDALLIESLWIVAAAALVGLLLTGPAVIGLVAGSLSAAVAWWLVGGISAVALGVLFVLAWKRQVALRYARMALPTARVVIVQAAIWALLGLAFWVL